MNILLVHDTRTVSLLTAVVLHRVLERAGHTVSAYFGVDSTRKTSIFWRQTARALPLNSIDRVCLCSMTFDDGDARGCTALLKQWADSLPSGLVVYTHRWPDGYARAGLPVVISPFEIVEQYAVDLDARERDLLRYSLIIARQADPGSVSTNDFAFCEYLSYAIWNNDEPNTYYWRLVKELDSTLRSLESDNTNNATDLSSYYAANAQLIDVDEGCVFFDLKPGAKPHYEKTIEANMRLLNPSVRVDDHTLGFGFFNEDDLTRVYIKRPWTSHLLPSVEWLLEQFSEECGLPGAEFWYGQQDAKNLAFERAGLTGADTIHVKKGLRRLASTAYHVSFGERSPDPALARVLHESATRALGSLDLKKAYVNSGLDFDPARIRIRIDRGNRSGSERSTVVLTLNAATAEGAAFLYANAGYNFSKLERLLEGILIGLGNYGSVWLGSVRVPERLRIDVHLSDDASRALPRILLNRSDVETLALKDAVQLKLLSENSSIYRILSEREATQSLNLIIFRESETIGPSVQYAMLAEELVAKIAEGRKDTVVLDMFAGSGLIARRVLSRCVNTHVFCVDKSISGRDSGLSTSKHVTWLQCDASNVVGQGALLEKDYDVVAMDPPHSAVLDLFHREVAPGKTFLAAVSERSPWLVVYQGHISQIGRAHDLARSLAQFHDCVALWTLGSETIMIAGPADVQLASRPRMTFNNFMDIVEARLSESAGQHEWTIKWEQMTQLD